MVEKKYNRIFGALRSLRFWVALLTLLVIFVSAYLPNFDLDVQHASALMVIVATYFVGLVVDPGDLGKSALRMFRSRKFWAALLGFGIIVLDAFHVKLPVAIDLPQLVGIAVTISAYIASVAFRR